MRFINDKLLGYVLIAFASVNIAFKAEARLPKHMAEKAAELLIEKNELQLKEEVTPNSFVKKMTDFLYSTEKRQIFADWLIKQNKIAQFKLFLTVVIQKVFVKHYTAR